ncbi:hypothetical protein SNOG_05224 [Parastagonospora nodorum SN15]|uniref:Uncharacterized protein n=1 Tax=Phaeosphaeria nodorum (strain SN15 / ATCC MYA-4574 / FGSC 10173) TaxID=321614 RepID=Q0USP0_PHANO|nr:hypothetical protein SNOG_05224 [Parastagonospora nodorum SN15]KAH3970114.1 hypothetical protein HBH51_119180 [Parastagonospora nodorum]EAT87615.1 hypothetical protein SNOG_05224 [Parastagonospora nodorum SN15]KAH4338487.1 hypothetical protein HBI00_005290 [Parastagonospora nodorum]KAH4393890.1 hypothetical protein HBH97_034760 [Parastagonospora nodorum]KAH6296612.1 hypothetical protein HBI40_053260 [Parastagonospora nodorum]
MPSAQVLARYKYSSIPEWFLAPVFNAADPCVVKSDSSGKAMPIAGMATSD